MGKVRSGDRRAPVHETIDVRPKKRKRKKDLEKLRRNVLEAKRNLRQRAAPPKIRKTSFARALNHFADQRQANDNKAQGIDSKGNRTARKTVCSRLLPALTTGKEIGIFAKGAKGGEIKRGSLTLNESNRARLQGDVHKLLHSGNLNEKQSVQNNFENISRGPFDENCAVDDSEVIPKVQRISPVLGKVNGAKRKLFIAAQQPGRVLKKLELKAAVRENLVLKTKVTKDVQEEEKYRRRLFEDDEKEFEAIDQFDVEELRISPNTVKTEVPAANSNVVDNENSVKRGNEKASLNFRNFYQAPTTRYEDLCAMVCAENFENCFQDVPHTADPLKKIRKTLMNIYADTCQRHLLRKKVKAGEQDEVRSSTLSDRDDCHPSESEDLLLGSNVEVEACTGIDSEDSDEFSNFGITLNPKQKKISKKQKERLINKNENELFVAALNMNFDPDCSKTHVEKLWNKEVKSSQPVINVSENSADDRSFSPKFEDIVERASRRKRKHVITQNANMSDVQDLHTASLKVHANVESPKTLRSNLIQKFPAGLESTNPKNVNVPKNFIRGDLVMRYPEETFPLSAPDRAPTKRYIGDPLRRHEVVCEVSRKSLEIDEGDENPDKISATKNFGTRNEKHVPAILRRSGCRGLTRYKSENAELIATLLSRELEISNAGSSRDDVTESKDVYGKEEERSFGNAFSKESPVEGFLASQMTKDPRSFERGTFQTPSIMNMFNERNEHVLKSKRNFMNAKYKTGSRVLVRETDRNESLPNEIFVQAETSHVPSDDSEFTIRERLRKVRNAIQRQNSDELKCSEGQSKKILVFEKKDSRNCQRFCDVGLAQRHDETTRDGASILKKVKFAEQDPRNLMNFVIQHPGSDSNGIRNLNDFKQQNPQNTYQCVHRQQGDVRLQNSQGLQNFAYKEATGSGTNDNAQNVQVLSFENLHDPTKLRSFVHRNDPVPQNEVRQNVVFENRNSQNLQNVVLKETSTNGGQNLQILTFDEQQDPSMMRGSIQQPGTSHNFVQQKSRTFSSENLQSFVQHGVPDNAVQNHARYSRSFGTHSGVQNLQVLTLRKQPNPHKMQDFITEKLQGASPIPQRSVQPTKFIALENHQNPHRIPIYVRTESQSGAPRESSSRLVNFEQKQNRAYLLAEQPEPKILNVANRNSQGKDRLFYEQQVRIPMARENFQHLRKNAETDFLKYSHAATEAMYSQQNVCDTTNRNGNHRLMQNGQPYQDGIQNLEYPMMVYQGNANMDVSSVETDKIGCDGTSDVTRNEIFQNGVYQDGSQYQPRFGTDPNFDERSNAPKRIKLMNGKVGLLVPRNSSFQNVGQNQVPLVTYNALHGNNNSFEFTFDPSHPPAGYKRSQVEENSSQIYQHIVQPVYNVADTYPRQPAAPNYFPLNF